MIFYLNIRLFTALVLIVLCFASIPPSLGQSIEFQPSEIDISNVSGLSATALSTAYHAAIDSLSIKYGIPVTPHSIDKYKYIIISKIVPNDTWEARFGEKFKYMNLIILADALGKREIIRVENYPRDLRALSQTPDALAKYFKELNNNIFNLFSGYGFKHNVDSPVASVQLVVDASAKLNPIKEVVKDVFFQNQAFLKYKIVDVNEDVKVNKSYIIKAKIQENSKNGTVLVSLLFNASVDLNYDGKPIQSEFIVEAADLKNKDYSFLLAKMTASLYKFSKSNIE